MTIMTKYMENVTVRKSWGFIDDDGIYNSMVLLKEYDKPLRARSEMLIIKGRSLFMELNNDKYRLPGGTWDENEDPEHSAVRETKEEVRINVKNVKYCGCYAEIGDVSSWMYEKIRKENWWYGKYSEVFVGEYDGKYRGYIAEEDKDNMYKKGKFYPINIIYERLKPIHKKAIDTIFSQ